MSGCWRRRAACVGIRPANGKHTSTRTRRWGLPISQIACRHHPSQGIRGRSLVQYVKHPAKNAICHPMQAVVPREAMQPWMLVSSMGRPCPQQINRNGIDAIRAAKGANSNFPQTHLKISAWMLPPFYKLRICRILRLHLGCNNPVEYMLSDRMCLLPPEIIGMPGSRLLSCETAFRGSALEAEPALAGTYWLVVGWACVVLCCGLA